MTKKRTDSWNNTKGRGEAAKWLFERVTHDGDDCLIWPFYRMPTGYGQLGYLGMQYYSHRFMCELIHGPAPSLEHDAAHSCGKGHDGCVHPKHLSWKTRSGNLLDAVAHGTHVGNRHTRHGQLSPEQVRAIRQLKGQKTQDEIARMFGIKPPSVRDIYLGRTYSRVL